MRDGFLTVLPKLMVEPGRYLVADAGVLRTGTSCIQSSPSRSVHDSVDDSVDTGPGSHLPSAASVGLAGLRQASVLRGRSFSISAMVTSCARR
jgi:hypothetical protein